MLCPIRKNSCSQNLQPIPCTGAGLNSLWVLNSSSILLITLIILSRSANDSLKRLSTLSETGVPRPLVQLVDKTLQADAAKPSSINSRQCESKQNHANAQTIYRRKLGSCSYNNAVIEYVIGSRDLCYTGINDSWI